MAKAAASGAEATRVVEGSARGVSLVLDPFGDVISDVMHDEGLLYCAFDPDDVLEPKQFHDLSGSYNRFDVFDLRVNRRRVVPISFTPRASTEAHGHAAPTVHTHVGAPLRDCPELASPNLRLG